MGKWWWNGFPRRVIKVQPGLLLVGTQSWGLEKVKRCGVRCQDALRNGVGMGWDGNVGGGGLLNRVVVFNGAKTPGRRVGPGNEGSEGKGRWGKQKRNKPTGANLTSSRTLTVKDSHAASTATGWARGDGNPRVLRLSNVLCGCRSLGGWQLSLRRTGKRKDQRPLTGHHASK